MRNRRICVVVPAFNEASVIGHTIARITEYGYQVVVVDDCSTDGTFEVASRGTTMVIRHIVNLGQGASLQTGFDYVRDLDIDVVVTFDADGQHDAADISSLVQPVLDGSADIVLGTRFARPADIKAVPVVRRYVIRLATVVNAALSGIRLSDAHNGFRAISRNALDRMRLRENGMAHATEILYSIRALQLRYVEVPVRVHYTDYSIAKGQRSVNSVNVLIDLLLNKLFRG